MFMSYYYKVRLHPLTGPLIEIQSVLVLTDEIYSHSLGQLTEISPLKLTVIVRITNLVRS